MKVCNRNAINKFISRKFKKWNIYFGALVLTALKCLVLAALTCYFGDNGHKMQTSLFSKNPATWRLH